MPQGNISLLSVMLLKGILNVVVSVLLTSVCVHAAPPVDEICTIMSAKALLLPLSGSMEALGNKNLDKRLLAIDPYARYVHPATPDDSSPRSVQLGIEIFIHKSRPWIQSIPGGPSDQAGLPEVGILLAINGTKVNRYDPDLISALIDNGLKKKQFVLTISSSPRLKGKDYRVIPSTHKAPSITWRCIGNDVVIRIREFVTHSTAPGFSSRFMMLSRLGRRVILDLRGCSGGDLYEALEIAGMFVPSGLLLAKTYDRNRTVKIYTSPVGKKMMGPSWILIDNGTASAAEILAGILQFHQLSRVVGEQSYGKCLSQTLFPLSDGGILWLTTLDVRFPDNRSCTGTGLKPDIPYNDISIEPLAEICKKMDRLTGVGKVNPTRQLQPVW